MLKIADDELARLLDEASTLALAYWASVDDRPTYPQTSGSETATLFSRPWRDEGLGRAVLDDFQEIAARVRPSSARFFGYVVGSAEPVGAIGDMLASVLNQNVTAWRSAPSATAIERTVIGWLGEAVGCAGYAGSLCGGGSAANLMGLAMAREAKLPANETGARPGAVYTSEQAHMSIHKAVAMLGIGRNNLRLIPTDDNRRMRIDALEEAIAADRVAGLKPIAIVATVGTVATGAIDPLKEITAIAARDDIWLHVDGAYGGLAALAVPSRFAGLNRADSLSLDAHKWFYQPLECGCLLYRDQAIARQTFSHSGDYVRILAEDPLETFAFFEESMELSRRFRALKLWMSLQYHGRTAFRDAIFRDLDHAALLAKMVEDEPELELMATGSLSVVCFGHRTKDNEAILRRLNARGRVYLSNATIDGRFALRACFVNHRTTDEDVRAIVAEVLETASELNR